MDKKTELLHEVEAELQRIEGRLLNLYLFTYEPGTVVNAEPFDPKKLSDAIDQVRGLQRSNKDGSKIYKLREKIKDALGLIPSNMDEAFERLDAMLVQEDKDFIQKTPDLDKVTAVLHHSLGRYLRNEWRLWHGSPMSEYLRSIGVNHPDDMSGYIIKQYATARFPTWHQRVNEDSVVESTT